ncbi:nucleotide exchange factor GrpE [Candidatus Electronema sp. PJ]|uniref:nucleotide exchange factor GrpE n=1 Tax=Candidatus Electronema sp. PJ TaxID=3401572 RepID=UPI003AA831D0
MQNKEKPSSHLPGELLREKLVAFQREIADLKRLAKEQEEASLHREHQLFIELVEVLDVFDHLDVNLRRKAEALDKTSQSILKSMKAIQRKLLRLLSAHHIAPLDFPDRRAQPEQCVIIETRQAPGRENEEILAILKRGYVDLGRNTVLRKAEVVTVRNEV